VNDRKRGENSSHGRSTAANRGAEAVVVGLRRLGRGDPILECGHEPLGLVEVRECPARSNPEAL
jgi:hypothetical protein